MTQSQTVRRKSEVPWPGFDGHRIGPRYCAQMAGCARQARRRNRLRLAASDSCLRSLSGTHPALAVELKKHEQQMAAHIAQAQRICQLQKTNIENLYDCEKKQADDENKARATLT